MAYTIAVAGKGGTGKTTLSSIILDELVKGGNTPVLAIDADPNSNLNEWLDVEIHNTLGDLQAEVLDDRQKISPGMDKRRYVQMQLQMCLEEGKGFDLLAMGRTEGPGCYCYVNDILRAYLDELEPNYPYVVMDNEAGMEHLSRRTTRDVDLLLVVSDPAPIGIRSASRIRSLAEKLEVNISEAYLVINRLEGELPGALKDEIAKSELDLLGTVPRDEEIMELSLEQRSLIELSEESPARTAVRKMLKEAGL